MTSELKLLTMSLQNNNKDNINLLITISSIVKGFSFN